MLGQDARRVILQLLSVKASAATGDERSVYGVRLVRSTAITLDHVTDHRRSGQSGTRTATLQA